MDNSEWSWLAIAMCGGELKSFYEDIFFFFCLCCIVLAMYIYYTLCMHVFIHFMKMKYNLTQKFSGTALRVEDVHYLSPLGL